MSRRLTGGIDVTRTGRHRVRIRKQTVGTFDTREEAERERALACARLNATRRVRRSDGVVYFAQLGTGGPIKIGRAVNVEKRLRCMQTSVPEALRLLATSAGGPTEERALHRRFLGHRVRGEWFRPAPELLEFIASLERVAG